MSALNFDWVKETFKEKKDFVFFDIGCTHLQYSPSIEILKRFSNPKCYAFEPSVVWNDSQYECDNKIEAQKLGINYYNTAVSDTDGIVLLHPSITEDGKYHPWSNSIFKLQDKSSKKVYGIPYFVKSIKLETFCKENNVTPDFIHIDAEGAEFKILQNLGKYKPKCIWAEVNLFNHYETNSSLEEFNQYMESIGYYIEFEGRCDNLYCLKDFSVIPYLTMIKFI